jgi:general secretion pathway protein M
VLRLNREQMICLGALSLLLLTCFVAVIFSLQVWSSAATELVERREVFSKLEARIRPDISGAGHKIGTAPAAAFLDGTTTGIASAALQAHLSQLASAHQATLISYGVEPAQREDAPDLVRVQATVEIAHSALQALLYDVESRTPYVFVDSLTLSPSGIQRPGADPSLRLTLSLHAFWHRGAG